MRQHRECCTFLWLAESTVGRFRALVRFDGRRRWFRILRDLGQRPDFLERHQNEAVDPSKMFFVAAIKKGVNAAPEFFLVVVQAFDKEQFHRGDVKSLGKFEDHLECWLVNACFNVADVLLTSADFLRKSWLR